MDTKVVDSRPAEDGTLLRRRRSCDVCGARFTTHERTVLTPLMVVKKDGRREEFNPEKLRVGLLKACNKRSVSTDSVSELIRQVEATLRQEGGAEVGSERVGELVMELLFHLDQVAYVRFASVYQRFDDVQLFAQLIQRMSHTKRGRKGARSVIGSDGAGTNGYQQRLELEED
jgi:transcriptional repressor NrdR